MQDPIAAADELERCVRHLGFCGAMINGHTNGVYSDDPAIDAFWARVEALGVPIYLHPADPPGPTSALAGCSSLKRAMWEWGVETASHALRLVFGGVFDRFPGVTIILGHLGETLPYLLWRFDSRAAIYGLRLQKPPSEYIRAHMVVTTSGMFAAEPLTCALNALGADRVMFSVDYPYGLPSTPRSLLRTSRLTSRRGVVCALKTQSEFSAGRRTRWPKQRTCETGLLTAEKNRWWIVFASVLGLSVGNGPIMQFTFGVLLPPISHEFGWARGTVSSAIVIGLWMTGVATPLVGRLVDRFGVRAVALPAIALFSAATASVALVPASPLVFTACITVMGLTAAGQTPLVYAKAISASFDDKRGLALGIAMAGVGLGAAVVPQFAQALIQAVGWRGAYVGLGSLTFILAFPAVALFLRGRSAHPT